jgi:hypothetical protein
MEPHEFLYEKTTVGVLGAVGTWHQWAPHYGLCHLEALVRGFAPDLLCAEVNRADWEPGRIGSTQRRRIGVM